MGVFLALTFEDKLYKDYAAADPAIRDSSFQNLIITLREDGYFGFLGGTADGNETELQALQRECKEEGNLDITWLMAILPPGSFDRVCEHTLNDGFKVILYHAKITKAIAKTIIRDSVNAEHFFTETAGLNSVVIHSTSLFSRNQFLSCMPEEFMEIGKIIQSEILQRWGKLALKPY